MRLAILPQGYLPIPAATYRLTDRLPVHKKDTTFMQNQNTRHLGKLKPEPLLLAQILDSRFEVGNFTNFAKAPDTLKALLAEHGFEIDAHDEKNGGLLFAHTMGVPMHTDEKTSALWVLTTPEVPECPNQFIVGADVVNLVRDEVHFFDATVPHGVIASAPGLWAVFSIYVRKLGVQG
jgi:hypothetical protein